jgi:hypothetical protein
MLEAEDEDKLSKAAARAVRAQNLLGNELLAEAFKTLEDTYTAAWRSTLVGQADTREKLFMAVNIVGKVRDHLHNVITDGKLAAAELRLMAETAERKQRWQDVRG